MNVSILHNDVDISTYVVDYERNASICSSIGSIKLTLSSTYPTAINVWDIITIDEDDAVVARYFVSSISRNEPSYTIGIEAQDGSKKLSDYFIPVPYYVDYPSNARYWIEKFLDEVGLEYLFTDTGYGNLLSNNTSLGMTNAYDQIMLLLQMSGWYMHFDEDNIAVIGKLSKDISDIAYEFDDTEIISINVDRNDSTLRNRAVVWGGAAQLPGGTAGWVFAETKLNTSWNYDNTDYRTVVMSNSNIPNYGTAKAFANMIVNEYKNLLITKTVIVAGTHNIEVGDFVRIDNNIYSGTGMVTSLTISMSEKGLITTLVLDEKCTRLFGYFDFGDYVYIGTDGNGVWRKPLKISHVWTDYSTGLGDLYVTDLMKNCGLLACVTKEGQAYYRFEGGAVWNRINLTTAGERARAVTINRTNNHVLIITDDRPDDNLLYAETSGQLLAVSGFSDITLGSAYFYDFNPGTRRSVSGAIKLDTDFQYGLGAADVEVGNNINFVSLVAQAPLTLIITDQFNYGDHNNDLKWSYNQTIYDNGHTYLSPRASIGNIDAITFFDNWYGRGFAQMNGTTFMMFWLLYNEGTGEYDEWDVHSSKAVLNLFDIPYGIAKVGTSYDTFDFNALALIGGSGGNTIKFYSIHVASNGVATSSEIDSFTFPYTQTYIGRFDDPGYDVWYYEVKQWYPSGLDSYQSELHAVVADYARGIISDFIIYNSGGSLTSPVELDILAKPYGSIGIMFKLNLLMADFWQNPIDSRWHVIAVTPGIVTLLVGSTGVLSSSTSSTTPTTFDFNTYSTSISAPPQYIRNPVGNSGHSANSYFIWKRAGVECIGGSTAYWPDPGPYFYDTSPGYPAGYGYVTTDTGRYADNYAFIRNGSNNLGSLYLPDTSSYSIFSITGYTIYALCPRSEEMTTSILALSKRNSDNMMGILKLDITGGFKSFMEYPELSASTSWGPKFWYAGNYGNFLVTDEGGLWFARYIGGKAEFETIWTTYAVLGFEGTSIYDGEYVPVCMDISKYFRLDVSDESPLMIVQDEFSSTKLSDTATLSGISELLDASGETGDYDEEYFLKEGTTVESPLITDFRSFISSGSSKENQGDLVLYALFSVPSGMLRHEAYTIDSGDPDNYGVISSGAYGYLDSIETSNYQLPGQYIFGGMTDSGFSFYQKDPEESIAIERSTSLPQSRINVIRVDDRL